jgi:hypothetical protein
MSARVLLLGEVGGPIEALLRERDLDVVACEDVEKAATELRRSWVDLIVLDLEANLGTEAQILETLSEGLGHLPAHVVVSARGGEGTVPKHDRLAILESVMAALPERPRSPSDQIRSLRGLIKASSGDVSRVRLVLCASPARLQTVSRAALRIAAFRPPPEDAPLVPVPHTLATMPLGEDLDLDVVALPLVPAYAPLWPMALSRAHAVVRLDAAAARLLDEACTQTDRRHVDAEDLVPGFAEDDEERVADLVRAAIEKADFT